MAYRNQAYLRQALKSRLAGSAAYKIAGALQGQLSDLNDDSLAILEQNVALWSSTISAALEEPDDIHLLHQSKSALHYNRNALILHFTCMSSCKTWK